MKKLTKILAVLMAMGLSVSAFAGCVVDEGNSSSYDPYADGVEIDETKTQLNVYSYNGGFGQRWFIDLIQRFEEEYKDYQGVNGKVGVQIVPDHKDKTLGTAFLQNPGDNDVFFTEDVFYYEWVNSNMMYDISDALTTPLTEFGESKSIFDKMTPSQQKFYDTDTTDAGKKVYAVPYRMNVEGIIYDVELFEEESLYYAKGGAPSEYSAFTQANNANKATGSFSGTASYTNDKANASAGPDGLYGTDDDGLPATYDEFFALCDEMVGKGITPFTWTGASRSGYLGNILHQLLVDYEGLEGYNVYMNFSGTAKNLVESIDDNGNVTFKPATTITQDNAYLMSASAGRYYALSFFEKLISNSDYYPVDSFGTMYKHMMAQEDFLKGKYERTRYAFLLDGIWWENEADGVFAEMAEDEEMDSRVNRKFKLMQMPKATMNDIGEKATYSDNLHALCFVNGNIPAERVDLAKKFIRFCFTDASNINYNVLTGTPRVMPYTLTNEQKAGLSMFGQSLYALSQQQDALAYPFSNTSVYRMYGASRDVQLYFGGAWKVSGGMPFDSFYNGTATAKGVFTDSQNALKESLPGLFGN